MNAIKGSGMAHFLDGTDEDRPGLAAGLMLSGLAMLATQDALARMAGEHVSFWQFQAMRASGNVMLLTAFAWFAMGGAPRRPRRFWAVALRCLIMVVTTVFFFGGIPHVTIVEMAAGLYTYPIFVTILSAIFLGERVGIRRVSAVVVGATGAMLILQPGGEAFHLVKLMPVGAGLCYAGNVLVTRRWCRGENTITMALGIALSFVVIGLGGCLFLAASPASPAFRETFPFLGYGWRDAAAWVFGITFLCSILNASGNVILTKAYQSAESSWLAPFDYTYLIFATIAGVVFFANWPGTWQVAGMALIAGAGVFTAWRERTLKARLARDLGTELPPPGTRA